LSIQLRQIIFVAEIPHTRLLVATFLELQEMSHL